MVNDISNDQTYDAIIVGAGFARGLFLFSKAPSITFGAFNEKHTSKRVYLAYF